MTQFTKKKKKKKKKKLTGMNCNFIENSNMYTKISTLKALR